MKKGDRQTYSEHADEATRLATRATTGEERQAYERIAAVWQNLADRALGTEPRPDPAD